MGPQRHLLQIRPGERVAFVGATGAGKTSLISLLSRFYDVEKGSNRIDGMDVRQKDLRQLIGTVLQDPFILSRKPAQKLPTICT